MEDKGELLIIMVISVFACLKNIYLNLCELEPVPEILGKPGQGEGKTNISRKRCGAVPGKCFCRRKYIAQP